MLFEFEWKTNILLYIKDYIDIFVGYYIWQEVGRYCSVLSVFFNNLQILTSSKIKKKKRFTTELNDYFKRNSIMKLSSILERYFDILFKCKIILLIINSYQWTTVSSTLQIPSVLPVISEGKCLFT